MRWLLHGFFPHRTPLGIPDLSPQTGNTWKASCEPDPDLPRLCASEASKEAWVLRASLLKRPFSRPRRGCCPTLAPSVLFCSWLYPWESRDEVAEGVTIPSDRTCCKRPVPREAPALCHPSWDPDTGLTHSPKVGRVLRGTWGPIPNSQRGSEGGKGIGTLTKGYSNSRTKYRLFPLGSMWAWPRDRPGGTGSLLHPTLVTRVVQSAWAPAVLTSCAHPLIPISKYTNQY